MNIISIPRRLQEISQIQWFIILILMTAVIFGVRYFSTREDWVTIRVEVKGKSWNEDYSGSNTSFNPPNWFLNSVKAGDVSYGLDGKPIAKVIFAEQYNDVKPSIFLTASVKTITNSRTHKYSFANRFVETGSPIELVFPNTDILGQIVDMPVPASGYPHKNVIATIRIRDIEPWLVNKITVGDKMINKSNNNTIATILTKSVEDPVSNVYFTNPNGFTNQFLQVNPRLKDVVITLSLSLQKLSQGWTFAGNQILKVGSLDNYLRLSFGDYYLPLGEVQDFHDETNTP